VCLSVQSVSIAHLHEVVVDFSRLLQYLAFLFCCIRLLPLGCAFCCGFFLSKQFFSFPNCFRGFGAPAFLQYHSLFPLQFALCFCFRGAVFVLGVLCAASVFPICMRGRNKSVRGVAVSIHSVQSLHFRSCSFVVRSPFCVYCALSHPSVHVDQ